MRRSALKNFPKQLYVKQEQDGEETYLVANEDPAVHAEVNGKVRVGIYDLRVTSTVTARAEVA
jgi:hypothetical protein